MSDTGLVAETVRLQTRTVLVEPQTLERLTYGIWTDKAAYTDVCEATVALAEAEPRLRWVRDLLAFDEGRLVAMPAQMVLANQRTHLAKADAATPFVDETFVVHKDGPIAT